MSITLGWFKLKQDFVRQPTPPKKKKTRFSHLFYILLWGLKLPLQFFPFL